MNKYDFIVVGAGFAGATVAAEVAKKDKKVLIIEKRDHIGGNCYDYEKDGILIHKYGPHIFHTNHQEVYEFLSEYTNFYPYEHRVLGHIQDKLVPIPFNLSSLEECFDEHEELKKILIEEYGLGNKVPIMKLRENENPSIKNLAEFIFENVFKYYTMKQWGLKAEEIDPEVTARVPINISYDDRYFADSYQYMPEYGYTKIFENMLNHENIDILLNTDARTLLSFDFSSHEILFNGEKYQGTVIYTGAIDELLDYKLGELPYRSLDLILERHEGTFQKAATENYPGPASIYPYTRISEYKLFGKEYPSDVTYIHKEYPLAYDRHNERGNIPYYPIFTKDNERRHQEYVDMMKEFKNFILLGRLAEYRYYNMDAIIKKALEVAKSL